MLGVLVSWVGTVLWNRASGSVPISIAGQITVVQTIAGLIYVFAWSRRMPPPLEVLGITLLVSGVLLAIQRTRIVPGTHKQKPTLVDDHDGIDGGDSVHGVIQTKL